MILRGIAERRALCFTIYLLTALVVCGTVVAVGFSRLTQLPQGSAGALVLLGLVAIAGQSAESVRRRAHDLALARLRGRRGLRLLTFASAEPALVVLAGALTGAAAGWLLARVVVSAWLPAASAFTMTSDEWDAVGLVTVASLVIVLASSWRTTRAPLLQQLATVRRPRSVGTLVLFMQLVLVIGAGVAIYQAHQAARDRVDWVTLVSPAVIGLAAGQLVIWLLMALLAAIVPRTGSTGFGWFISMRRLLRRADSVSLIRLVVAAGVVFAVAASASTAAQAWREERARLQVGAPVSYPVKAGALQAFAAAQTADPKGAWLLPVAAYTTDSDPGSRRVFVSAERWKTVAGGFFAGTSSAPVTKALDALPPSPGLVYARGDSVTATVTTASLKDAVHLSLAFQYANDAGNLTVLDFPLTPGAGTPAGPGLTRITKHLSDCQLACSVVELDVNGYTQSPLDMRSLDFANQQLLPPSSGLQLPVDPFYVNVHRVGSGLIFNIRRDAYHIGNVLGTFGKETPQPAISTPGNPLPISHGRPTVEGIDGSARPVTVVARVPVLPFVGTTGAVLDLARVLQGSGGSIPGTQASILARADTPASVIAALRSTGAVGPPTTYDAELTRLDESPGALGTRLYLLIAAFAALIALVGLAAAVAQQRQERRLEAASLRSVGVRAAQIGGAYRREAVVLAVATLIGTSVAAWTCCAVLLGALPLVSGWAFAPPLNVSPQLDWISLTAVAGGVAVALASYLAFRRIGRSSAPRLLREDPG